ncbi:MAG: hypothetical protein K9G62_07285 [Alphaproteobacteria bacterium]|nr:hypothetical protein [Alphaproteobacteria bacterium]
MDSILDLFNGKSGGGDFIGNLLTTIGDFVDGVPDGKFSLTDACNNLFGGGGEKELALAPAPAPASKPGVLGF